jgi:hypothetical protein
VRNKNIFLSNWIRIKKKEYLATFYGLNKATIRDKDRVWNYMAHTQRDSANRYLRMYESKLRKMFNCTEFKKPDSKKDDWVGIEIECFLPRSEFSRNSNFNCDCYDNCECDTDNYDCECFCSCEENIDIDAVATQLSKLKIKGIQVVTDGSLESSWDNMFGVEIKCLTRVSDMSNLKQLCQWLDKMGAKVNATCGLHTHLDVSSLTDDHKETFFDNLGASLPFLFLMVPTSRHDNSYCKPQASMSDRYSAINGTAIDKHKTIEVRLHSGTTSFTKISNWCIVLQEIKNLSENYIIECVTDDKYKLAENMLSLLNLSYSTNYYIINRIMKFNPGIFNSKPEFNDITLEYDNEVA